jgi:hypothetical protein
MISRSSRSNNPNDMSTLENNESLTIFGINIRIAHFALFLFLINGILIAFVFFPYLDDIGLNDDAGYIHSGRSLLRPLARIRPSAQPAASKDVGVPLPCRQAK